MGRATSRLVGSYPTWVTKSFPAVVAVLALPTTRRAFRRGSIDLCVVGFLAKTRISLLLQLQRWRDAEAFVGVHEHNLAAGPHETQQQRAFARKRGDQFAHGVQLFRF